MARRALPVEIINLLRASEPHHPIRVNPLSTIFPKIRPIRPPSRSFSNTSQQSQAPEQPTTSSSVSATEVSHFSRLASSWWDPHGPSRLLHLMNPLRHDFIRSCLQSSSDPAQPQTLTYLDIGCGGGIFATSAARLPNTARVTAIDPTPEVIAVAKTKQRSDPALSEPKLQYLQSSIEELSTHVIPPVDILTVFEVLEHVSNPSHFLHLCLSYVKPGGWIIGSTIARSPLSFITTKLIAEAPIVGVVPRGTHDWNKYINPEELQEWCDEQPGLGNFFTQGVIYVPGIDWKLVDGSERFGNYFFGVRKMLGE